MRHTVGQTRNGAHVYVDLIRSNAATQIASRPQLLTLVKEVLAITNATRPEVVVEHDMGRNIGYDFVVPTTDKDIILYAQLLRDDVYTRFVKSGLPEATQFLSFVLRRNDDRSYELHNAWVGHNIPARPGSENATPEGRAYWENHAVVLTSQPIQSRTITRVCPY